MTRWNYGRVGLFLGLALLGILQLPTAQAQTTAFTYQGQLKQSGSPANGAFAMTFKLYDQSSGGTQQGSTLTYDGIGGDPAAVTVTNGLFTVSLDFGVNPYTANQNRWLEMAVSGTTLSPRTPLSPTPFALNTRGINVSATGNVGIATSNPTAKLHIGGTAGVDGLKFPDGTMQLTAATGGSGFWSASGANIFANNTGNVGIGRSSPTAKLDVNSSSGFGARIGMEAGGGGALVVGSNPGDNKVYIEGYNSTDNGSPNEMLLTGFQGAAMPLLTVVSNQSTFQGKVEIDSQDALNVVGFQPFITLKDSNNANRRARIQNVDGNAINFFTEGGFGSGIPVVKMRPDGIDIAGQNAMVAIGYQPFFTLADSNAGYAQARIQGAGGEFVFYTQAGINSGSPPMRILNTGVTEVKTLRILGGADLAEPFDIAGDKIEPGMVVVIDSAHPGQLKPCTSKYDRKVAGILSGAGGVSTGLSMGHQGTLADGKHSVALTGRVYCKVDASYGAIEAGDVLTTSPRLGHAMKAGDLDKARGAIIGKAMTTLEKGTGLVLVLVNLQ